MTTWIQDVRNLNNALGDYERRNPDIVPYSLLESSEGEARILNREAAAIWDDIAKQQRDNGVAHHHLAVIRHGCAFAARMRNDHGEQAIADWSAGLTHWRAVVASDSFWNHLTSVWTARRDGEKGEKLAGRLLAVDLAAFRKALPAQLLKIHVDIIQDTLTSKPAAAQAHIRLIRESGFGDAPIRDAMNQIYNLAVGSKKHGDPNKAAEAIDAYLTIDSTSIRALQDRVEVAIRIANDEATSMSSRVAALNAARNRATALKTNSSTNDNDYDRTSGVLRDFWLAWARLCNKQGIDTPGSGKAVNAHFCEGFSHVLQACDFERTGVSARELLVTIVSNVSHTCQDAVSESLNIVDKAIQRFPTLPMLYYSRIRVRLYQGQFSQVDNDLAKARELSCAAMDPQIQKADSEIEAMIKIARDFGNMTVVDLVFEAKGLMDERQWQAAVSKLDAAKRAQPRRTEATSIIENMERVCRQVM